MTHTFTHAGRRWRLFKRAATPGASWYIELVHRGTRHKRSLGAAGKARAIEKARLFIDGILADELRAVSGLLHKPLTAGYSTVSEVLEWSAGAALGCSDDTARQYRNQLRLMLRQAGHDPDRTDLSALTPETVRAYFRAAQARAHAAADQDHAGRIQRTANSIMRQACGLFSVRYQGDMRDAGLVLPDLAPFFAEVQARKFRRCNKQEWHAPSDQVIRDTLTRWGELSATHPEAYRAMWLSLSCGLRAGEIAQARWSWITQLDGHPWIDSKATVKNLTGHIRVRPLDPFWTQGRANCEPDNKSQIVPTNPDETFRQVGRLMRDCGWQTVKTNHALRALAGAWVAKKYGIYEAQRFLRHASVTVTEQHYSYLSRPGEGSPGGQEVQWAE